MLRHNVPGETQLEAMSQVVLAYRDSWYLAICGRNARIYRYDKIGRDAYVGIHLLSLSLLVGLAPFRNGR